MGRCFDYLRPPSFATRYPQAPAGGVIALLKIENLTYRIAGRLLFDDVSAVVNPGHKVGIVGRNGAGKTTLFGLIVGVADSDSGRISVPPHWRVGMRRPKR